MLSADFKRKGSFADVVLPGLLVPALNARFTGMFRAERESIIKVIYFKEGEIAFASSNQPSDRLGEVLIKRGQLTREQLDMAMSKLEANVSLGRMLVELGYLSPKELLGGAKTQVEEILYSLNTWREGGYEFVEGPLPPKIVDLKLNTRQVIFQCVLQVENRQWVLQQLGSMESVFAREDGLDTALQGMAVEPDVQQVIQGIDGRSTVRDLCARSRLDEFTVTKIAAGLHLLGLTRIAETGAAGGEFVARFGEEPEQSLEDQQKATVISRVAESETVPGFAPSFEPEQEEEEPIAATSPGTAVPEESTLNLDAERAEPLVSEETEAPPAADEEITYEEEGLAEEEAAPGRRLMPLIAASLAALVLLVGGYWWFFLRGGAEGGGEPTPVAAMSPAAAPRTPAPATPAVAAGAGGTPAVAAAASPLALASPAPAASAAAAAGATGPAAVSPAVKPTPVAMQSPLVAIKPTPGAATALASLPPVGRTPEPVRSPAATPKAAAATPTRPPVRLVDATPPPRPPSPARPAPTAATAAPTSAPRAATPVPTRVAGPAGPRGGEAAAMPSGAALDGARDRLRAGEYRDAAGGFRQALGGASGYTLQLEIVCQDSSVKEGLSQAAGAGEYFILPFTFRGRPCYRAFWGVFPSRAAAQAAQDRVPAFFRSQMRGRPFPVVSLGSVR